MRVDRELGLRVVIKLGVRVEEATEAGDLGREEHDDDLHLDVELELEDVLARLERLRARRDEHVAVDSEGLERVDQLAELGAPAEHAELVPSVNVNVSMGGCGASTIKKGLT